jgi:hypothetical protein
MALDFELSAYDSRKRDATSNALNKPAFGDVPDPEAEARRERSLGKRAGSTPIQRQNLDPNYRYGYGTPAKGNASASSFDIWKDRAASHTPPTQISPYSAPSVPHPVNLNAPLTDAEKLASGARIDTTPLTQPLAATGRIIDDTGDRTSGIAVSQPQVASQSLSPSSVHPQTLELDPPAPPIDSLTGTILNSGPVPTPIKPMPNVATAHQINAYSTPQTATPVLSGHKPSGAPQANAYNDGMDFGPWASGAKKAGSVLSSFFQFHPNRF